MFAGYNLERGAKMIHRNIGIIFQNQSLDTELTAEENIRLISKLRGMPLPLSCSLEEAGARGSAPQKLTITAAQVEPVLP